MKSSFRERLKRGILRELRQAGLGTRTRRDTINGLLSKDEIRELHFSQRKHKLRSSRDLLSNSDKFLKCFAEGCELNPAKIKPRLIPVESDTFECDLFRFASFLWSVPVSPGYGRRLRFLVWDDYADKLMGIFALGDPVFNLKARDTWIDWKVQQRTKHLCHVLDAYVLGAVPPYSNILGGKLIASMVACDEVRVAFRRKYGQSRGVISKKRKSPRLALITTTSALGRSSIYNRVRFRDELLFEKVGETEGWGHFHLSDNLFKKIRSYLKMIRHPYADGHQFGDGPNWRLRTLRIAFDKLGLSQKMLRHGIRREVYMVPLAKNIKEFLRGEVKRPVWKHLPLAQLATQIIWRWMVPRAERDSRFKLITREMIYKWITHKSSPSVDLPPLVLEDSVHVLNSMKKPVVATA